MTATIEQTADDQADAGVGRVARVTGPVVDVEFPAEAHAGAVQRAHVDVTFDRR